MTKNKRVVCLFLLVLTLVMTFCISAGAEEDHTAQCEIPIALDSGGGTLECTFVLEAISENAPMPIDEPVISLCSGKAVFPAIEYTLPGIYAYTVKQTTANAPEGWSLDERVLDVTVYVTSNDDGELDTSVITSFTGGETKDNVFKNCFDTPDTGDGELNKLTVSFVAIAGIVAVIEILVKKKKKG